MRKKIEDDRESKMLKSAGITYTITLLVVNSPLVTVQNGQADSSGVLFTSAANYLQTIFRVQLHA